MSPSDIHPPSPKGEISKRNRVVQVFLLAVTLEMIDPADGWTASNKASVVKAAATAVFFKPSLIS